MTKKCLERWGAQNTSLSRASTVVQKFCHNGLNSVPEALKIEKISRGSMPQDHPIRNPVTGTKALLSIWLLNIVKPPLSTS